MANEDSIAAKIGTYAPDFRLPATTGVEIGLSDFRSKTNIILFFVREYT